jgi:predicted DsbA family dithiol-disulfide isomerase
VASYGQCKASLRNGQRKEDECHALGVHVEGARGSTIDAHRLNHLGAEHGLQNEMSERFLRGYFTASLLIGEPDILARLTAGPIGRGLAVQTGSIGPRSRVAGKRECVV